MEFKANTKVQTSDIAQLQLNWMLATEANPTKKVDAALILQESDTIAITPTHIQYLHVLRERYGFNPVIRSNKDRKLYPL
jgi:hypothetical protein